MHSLACSITWVTFMLEKTLVKVYARQPLAASGPSEDCSEGWQSTIRQAKGADLAVGLQAICSHLGVVEVGLALGLMAAAALLGLRRHAPGAALLSRLAVACLPAHDHIAGTSTESQNAEQTSFLLLPEKTRHRIRFHAGISLLEEVRQLLLTLVDLGFLGNEQQDRTLKTPVWGRSVRGRPCSGSRGRQTSACCGRTRRPTW